MTPKKSISRPLILKTLGGLLVLSLFFNTTATAGTYIRLNYEALRWRTIITALMDTVETVRETLMLANIILPIQVNALTQKSGRTQNFDGDKFYKDMLSKKSSDEVFQMFFEFLADNENNGIHIPIRHLFIDGKRDNFFETPNGVKFYIRWLWLYPSENGLSCVPQEEMTDSIAKEIWNSQILFPIFEVHYPLGEKSGRVSAFFQKGVDKIFVKFPSARTEDDEQGNPEIVHLIFPSATGIPEIIRKTIELKN